MSWGLVTYTPAQSLADVPFQLLEEHAKLHVHCSTLGTHLGRYKKLARWGSKLAFKLLSQPRWELLNDCKRFMNQAGKFEHEYRREVRNYDL